MGMWVRKGPVIVGRRIAEWRGDTGGAATSFPPDTLAAVSFDTSPERTMRLWAYSPAGGDLLLTIPFGELVPEEGSWAGYATGRFDPQNLPVVLYHGQIKVLVKAYNGGGSSSAPLLRILTNVFYE